jgi:hypothetical protein
MTYIPSTATNNGAAGLTALTILKNTSTDISISAGSIIPLGSESQLFGASSYTVSSGEITLPSGYVYVVKAVLGCYGPTVTGDQITYQLYDTTNTAYVGRRGSLIWQESPKLQGGDEYAIALIDASTTAQTIDLRILGVSSAGFIVDPSNSTTAQFIYAGRTRVEVFKI